MLFARIGKRIQVPGSREVFAGKKPQQLRTTQRPYNGDGRGASSGKLLAEPLFDDRPETVDAFMAHGSDHGSARATRRENSPLTANVKTAFKAMVEWGNPSLFHAFLESVSLIESQERRNSTQWILDSLTHLQGNLKDLSPQNTTRRQIIFRLVDFLTTVYNDYPETSKNNAVQEKIDAFASAQEGFVFDQDCDKAIQGQIDYHFYRVMHRGAYHITGMDRGLLSQPHIYAARNFERDKEIIREHLYADMDKMRGFPLETDLKNHNSLYFEAAFVAAAILTALGEDGEAIVAARLPRSANYKNKPHNNNENYWQHLVDRLR